jgi:pyruvate,orthophosphate dikinase
MSPLEPAVPSRRRRAAPVPQPRALSKRLVYRFGAGQADGSKEDRNLLGGKGANLAEMCRLGLPVPPGFTITTEVCTHYHRAGTYPPELAAEVEAALAGLERSSGKGFGQPDNPLLVSVRSGARVSMPGMMDTVLNLGLNDATVAGLAARTQNPRFAWDAYRRFVQMYADVVLEVRAESDEDADPFEAALSALKARRGVRHDTELSAQDLEGLVAEYKRLVERHTGRPFPEEPREQLWGAIAAVFRSWDNQRAIAYRQMHQIPSDWGTAVSVCTMVFGNLGQSSGTGVAFTRDPSTGEKRFYGEYLINAQGEDVVAGIRTPEPIAKLERESPRVWKQLISIQKKLEKHFRDMQDIEFTVEDGRLYMLQCRVGKRTGPAAVRIAVDLVKERLIRPEEALLRIDPETITQLLAPVFDDAALAEARAGGRLLTRGLNAGPGAATGRIAFSAARAEAMAKEHGPDGKPTAVVLVRVETSPEDIKGMQASVGILTARGGMTSHAALVARQMGRVCVAGASELSIDLKARRLDVGGQSFGEGDWISLDGTRGDVYAGAVPTRPSEVLAHLLGAPGRRAGGRKSPLLAAYLQLMAWADERRKLLVRANADQPDQAAQSVALGAEGIGLCRTEHMFFGPGKIEAVREMILAEDAAGRAEALAKLLPLQREDFEGIFRAMQDRPVTIRALDPPLHEFLPHDAPTVAALAASMGIPKARLSAKVQSLSELNPMLGHRGCRLGITYPEITRTQARAIFEAGLAVKRQTRKAPRIEIMIPLVSTERELALQAAEIRAVAEQVFAEQGQRLEFLLGTMIELPRACLVAGEIAASAQFFSFGTNDLTQTTFGISRDDAGKFIPTYVEQEIFPQDPFASLDLAGVGRLMEIAVREGRRARPDLKLGICGEHGGDPRSIHFCSELGLEYVSCSAFRVPIARLAAAQAALRRQAGLAAASKG